MATVLITGASGGIGYELAKLFARDHHYLVLVARSGDKLAQVAVELRTQNVTVKTIALDLATPPAPKFLFDQLQTEGVTVDILINNAGFGAFGEFAQMSNEEISGQIQLNIIALTELTRLFLPPMLARRSGRIMNANLAEYHVPVNADVPSLEVLTVDEHDPHVNALGIKGVGEIGVTGSAGAVANAVWHATGVRVRRFPIRIEDIVGGEGRR